MSLNPGKHAGEKQLAQGRGTYILITVVIMALIILIEAILVNYWLRCAISQLNYWNQLKNELVNIYKD